VQLENLQLAANAATAAINAWGPLLNNRLHDILMRVQEITLHGVHCGVAVALDAA
jgi:hypothetical protein